VVNPTNGLGLPPAPPLPPDVRERVRRALLDEIDATDTPVPTPARRQRWAPLLTAAAVALVAVAVAAVVALSGAHPDRTGPPAAGPSAGTLAPLPGSERPAPTGEAGQDAALLRCATAVASSGRGGEYPPTATWTSTMLLDHQAPLENELVVNGSFGCLLTPTTVVVTGTTGTPLGGVQVIRLTADELVLLNPQDRRFTIGLPRRLRPDIGPVTFYRLEPGVSLGDLQLTVDGDDGYRGPVPEPVAALTVVDRPLPTRAPDAPGAAELAACLRTSPDLSAYPDLWMPAGRHDVGTAPSALVARISDVAAGFCVQDPAMGPIFIFGSLPAPGDRPEAVVAYSAGASAALVTAPPGVTRVVVSPRTGTAAATDCTITDGLAMCTLDDPTGQHLLTHQSIVVTAFTAADPQGIEVLGG
jgi:hypothetical protein